MPGANSPDGAHASRLSAYTDAQDAILSNLVATSQPDSLTSQPVIRAASSSASQTAGRADERLLWHPVPRRAVLSTRNLTYLRQLTRIGTEWRSLAEMDHLACYVPGMLALAWRHSDARGEHKGDTLLSIAGALLESCMEMYRTPSGLAPDIVQIRSPADGEPPAMVVKSGSEQSQLRPETVESLFVLWRVTQNATYREWGWQIFEAIERHAKVPTGGYMNVASVLDVPTRPHHDDKMETWFIAETLKVSDARLAHACDVLRHLHPPHSNSPPWPSCL